MIVSKKSRMLMTMMLAATSLMSCVYARSEKKERHDPLVGSYAVNISIGVYAVWSFHQDGTVTFQDSVDIQQPFPPLAPAGLYGTINVGKWKKVCKGSYKYVQSPVFNLKDITTRNECGDLLFAGIPFARAKVEGTVDVSNDCQFITGTFMVTLYEVDDISLTKRLIIDGQPVPPVSGTFIGQRIDF